VAGFPPKIDSAVSEFTDQREALVRSGHLTPAGLRDQLRRNATGSLVPLLRRARGELIAARSAAAAKRLELTVVPIDKSDLVGALVRREIREHLRSLSEPERMQLLADSNDQRVWASIPRYRGSYPSRPNSLTVFRRSASSGHTVPRCAGLNRAGLAGGSKP
jgi:hypothetical protein